MQVMVCKNEINWRNDSLHMIIFSTDAESHYAGDGKVNILEIYIICILK
jgi:integrin beta 6